MAAPTPRAVFTTYARLWVATEALLLHHDPFVVPHRYYVYALVMAFVAATLRPSKATLCAAMLIRIAMFNAQAPCIWESNIWANIVDLAFVAACLSCPNVDAVVPSCANVTRLCMGFFYVGAGFWKINSAFLDPRASCASIYVVSLVSYLPAALTPPWLVRVAVLAAPSVTCLLYTSPSPRDS